MKKLFVGNLILLFLLNLIIKPFWIFGIDRTVQNQVGAGEYGLYFSLYGLTLILSVLLDLGITNANNRAIAAQPRLLADYFSRIISLRLILIGLYLILCMGLGLVLGYNARQLNLLFFLAVSQSLVQFILYLRSNISGLQQFKTDSLLSVIDKTLMIVAFSFLLWGSQFAGSITIETFVYVQTLIYALTALLIFMLVWHKAGVLRIRFSVTHWKPILKQSLPFALYTLLVSFFYRIDSVLLERLLPDGNIQAGIYAQAFRILDALWMFGTLFGGLLLPLLARMLSNGQDVKPLIRLSLGLLFVPSATFAFGSLFYGNQLMQLLYQGDTAEAAQVYSLLMLGFIGIAFNFVFGTLLTANGNLKQLNLIALSCVAASLLANMIVIPLYKATGSAAICMSIQFLNAGAQVYVCRKTFGFSLSITQIRPFVLFTVLLLLACYLTAQFIPLWLPAFVVLTLISVLLAFATRVFSFNEWSGQLRNLLSAK